MFNKILITLLSALIAGTAAAGPAGTLTDDIIKQIQDSNQLDPEDLILLNALTNNDIKSITLNHHFLSLHNDHFNHVIKTKGITDQQSSGRCWLFAVLNTLRPKVIDKYDLADFEFSQTYLFFWDKFEKANCFLEWIIESADKNLLDRQVEYFLNSPFNDGGYWSYVAELISKYGLVPKEAMPETHNSLHSWPMNDLISRKLREDALALRTMAKDGSTVEELRQVKIEMLKIIYHMMVLNLGQPPRSFVWRYENAGGKISDPKVYTPRSFCQDVVNVDLKDYVPLMNHPGKEYYRLYIFDHQKNIFETQDPIHVNIPMDDMELWTMKAVLADEPLYFACDIIPDKYKDSGILSTKVFDYQTLYDVKFEFDKSERIMYYESAGNHAMALIGVDVQNGIPVKWLVEDSHGKDEARDGYWTMYRDWFKEFVYVVILPKKYVPQNIIKILDEKPISMPPWDPMSRILRNSD